MEVDERLRWFEIRVTSSLKPRAEELKYLFSNEESRKCLLEFCNNVESRHLFVCFTGENGKSLVASFKAVTVLKSKALFFIKSQSAGKITRDNINEDVFYCSCNENVVEHFEILTKEIFLPLLSIEQAGGVSADKLMDILHRLISCLQTIQGNVEGEVRLSLPSIEVLSEAASYSHRKLAVIHILETYLIGWIKQIKTSLKLDPETEIARRHGKSPGPLCEAEAWAHHLERIRYINEQLCSPVIVNILTNLEEACSTYAQSFHNVKREISKIEMEADDNLQYLSTMTTWFQGLSYAPNTADIIPYFAPLMHTLFLVWQHSRYYHKTANLTRLLKMISIEVVKRARGLLCFNILDDLISAHSNLKEALQICASFRGCYLDTKDKADAVNEQKLAERKGTRTNPTGVVWHSRKFKEAKTPKGLSLFTKENDQKADGETGSEALWEDSPWPPRNSQVFEGLNFFMERCNDVLELVETKRHFRMLRNAAEVGGAGGQGLDAMVREIHDRFEGAMIEFKNGVQDVLDLEHSQPFERCFFIFRSVIRELETRLGYVLKDSFKQCWDMRSRLRLLEVFEGTSSRDLVQKEIKTIVDRFVPNLNEDIIETRNLFENGIKVCHPHIPPLANELLWLNSLKERLKTIIQKLKLVSPASLKGDEGWKLRDTYSDLIKDIEKSEKSLFTKWESDFGSDLKLGLRQSLLTTRVAADGLPEVEVNIDSNLQKILKEVYHFQRPPLELRLPDVIRLLIRNTDPLLLQANATRLDTVASQYNRMIRMISNIERPLFEIKLYSIEQLLQEGCEKQTWQGAESNDFIERITNLVCNDVSRNANIARNNLKEICRIADAWVEGDLDVFGAASDDTTMYIDELHSKQRELSETLCYSIEMGGRRIHELMKSTFEAVQISRASPIWQSYTEHVSNIVIGGLKRSILKSLNSMLRRIEAPQVVEPILAIRLELVSSEITFIPPLMESSAAKSLHEYVDIWLDSYLSRASKVAPVYRNEDYLEVISSDNEVSSMIEQITSIVSKRIEDCKEYLETFKEYGFLWIQDVKFTFEEFLKGNISSRAQNLSRIEDLNSSLSNSSRKEKEGMKGSSRASSAVTTLTSTVAGTGALSEKSMLAVKRLKLSKEDNAPSLDDFDREMEVYRVARDEIHATNENCQVGWINVNMQPIRKTIETYASKWVFTFTNYLASQVSSALNDLDAFLKRIEPGVEAITGEERDIISFMRLMRIFNEVTAQQSELDTKFATMKRTLSLLEKYDQKLPETTQTFYSAAPIRWNNLKMKVNQAKQRLGPRIQAEADSVTQTLKQFGERCLQLDYDFRCSEAFNRSCLLYTAHSIMDSIEKNLNSIESEAQDLVELQELLEQEVIDFSILPSLRSDLAVLRQVWETARLIQEQQSDWKRHRWQKIRPRLLRKLLGQQEDMLKSLPQKAASWDVTIGIQQSIERMLSCVPIMEDLSKAAMRTRHWKQLVRATGGAVNVSSDGLTKMTLGRFLDLGLQNHADEVRGVIQRASKEEGIEKALKTYEEVWLSKMFELVKHTRLSIMSTTVSTHDTPASEYGNESDHGANLRQHGSRISLSNIGLRAEPRARSLSILSGISLRQSAVNLMDQGEVLLLKNIEPILKELELHQLSLQSMLGGSAASSFADDIIKWQKTLQNLEAVLNLWWEAQEKWVKLDDVYSGRELRTVLPREANLFAIASSEFRIILKLAEKNPNVLQICSREGIFQKLEKINVNFEVCLKALMYHLDKRKQKFPRFYFLSQDDVLEIVCKGYDPGKVSPYLTKILRNACTLDYDLQEGEDRQFYRITGIRSIHGETLKFVKPVDCETSVELWLHSVLSAIKSSLQVGLASALGVPIPESLKFGSSSPHEAPPQDKKETKGGTPVSSQQRKVIFAPDTEAVEKLEHTARSEINLPSSWSLRNPNEIVILALQIELTQKFEKCLDEIQSGDKDSLERMHQHLSAILRSASDLLQGASAADRVHEVITSQPLDKNCESVNDEEANDEGDASESTPAPPNIKIVLSPRQIQKLTNLIFILSAKCDLALKLSKLAKTTDQNDNKEGEGDISKTFERQAQLKYFWSQSNATCNITMMDYSSEYGFEYQGTASRIVSTPETDRALFWTIQGMSSCAPCLIIGSSFSGKEEVLLELSNAFGFPVFDFNCSKDTSTKTIGEIFKGIALTGSWGMLRNLDRLSGSALSVITQLLANVFESLKAKKSTFLIHDDDIPLCATSKFFGTLNLTSEFVDTNVSYRFPLITSSIYHLPADLLSKFRTVCLSKPDRESILKMYLVVHGFNFSHELAKILANLFSMWKKLTVMEVMPSLRVLNSIITDAGDYLDKLKAADDLKESVPKDIFVAVPTQEEYTYDETTGNDNEPQDEAHYSKTDTSVVLNEEWKNNLMYIEKKSILLALRSAIVPSLSGADAVMFATLLSEAFPMHDVPLIFDRKFQDITEQRIANDIIGVSLGNTDGEPLRSLPGSPLPKDQAVSDVESAICIAVQKIGIPPNNAFISRVVQLFQLVSSHKTVIVVGPPGCGKTQCIRALISSHTEMGHNIIHDSIFLGVAANEDLFGHYSKRGWVDGFIPSILRRKLHEFCRSEIGLGNSDSQDYRWILLDGKLDPSQMEAFTDMLIGSDDLVLPNSERLHLPSSLRFIWEVDSLDGISPEILSGCGMLRLSEEDVGWHLIIKNWISKQPQADREILTELSRRYIKKSIDFLVNEKVVRHETATNQSVVRYNNPHGELQHAVSITYANMVQNLIAIFEAMIYNAQDASIESFENFFNFSAFWAFGGNLLEEYRAHFSDWWREQWSQKVAFPDDVSLWQCYVHPETHEFINVSDVILPYAGNQNASFSSDDHVVTAYNMVISHIIGALAENGKPALLIGPAGCGKSHIIKDRLQNNASDVAEVQSLFVNANKFITSETLWQRMNECLEWKHTHTYVPKGNKKLICLIDDINHSYANKGDIQTACETVRQLLDQNGSFYVKGWKWCEIKDVTFLATYNPWTTVSTPKLNGRLLNKWVTLYMPYPCQDEQRHIYNSFLTSHFIPSASASSTQIVTEDVLSSRVIRQREREEELKKLIDSLVTITVEVQENLRSMFLPTPSRSHYIFTLNNLGTIFRNICLVLRSSCTQEELISAWRHECENTYGNILMDKVDKERWMHAVFTAARKKLNKAQLEMLTKPSCFISNLIDVETKKKGSKGIKALSEADESSVVFSSSDDSSKARAIVEHNIREYNKDNPRVKIYLYEETVKFISRLIRILHSPHECGHTMIIANGFPGLPLSVVKVSAYICGFNLYQIYPSFMALGEKYTIRHFQSDIINAYTTAGLKGEKLLFVLNEMELYDEDFLVFITEFLVSNSISHLFNEEEHLSITNAIRTEVTQAGLSYTKEIAWNFFLKTVRENLRFVFIASSLDDSSFQKRCRQFPNMINSMQIISMSHWTKDELVMTALFHLKDVDFFNDTEKENFAHLLASMHLALSDLNKEKQINTKLNNITNKTFERFVEHFVDMALQRNAQIDHEYQMIAETLEAIESGSELAKQLNDQLDHEKLVHEQKKQGNFTLLSQIGQDQAITEEQVKLVQKQQWKIEKLQQLLPRYQDAHERAVFKAAAVVKETKRVLADLEQQGLSDLRSMQKADSDIEDVLAAIIIIVKSPTSDLTWHKGAKRIMANLERFREELYAFDEMELTEDTLQVVEPYTKRPHFAPGFMEKKTSNLALESLVMWVCGVVRYHRMMLSRVKPLHKMVEQTTVALDDAVEKLSGMEGKLKNLNDRMVSLSGKYEDASVDKSRQGLLTEDQQHQLTRAAYFEKLLSSGRQQWTRVLDSIYHRKQSMVGSIAIASGFATYLGVYSYELRQHIIEVTWPNCLKERGILRDISIADNLTIDITMSMSKVDTEGLFKKLESTTSVVSPGAKETGEQEKMEHDDASKRDPALGENIEREEEKIEEERVVDDHNGDGKEGSDEVSPSNGKDESTKQMKVVESIISNKSANSLYSYDQYLLAIINLLTGSKAERNLISKGINYRKLEDAAIINCAVQTPLLFIDPFNNAMNLLSLIMGHGIVSVDMSNWDGTVLGIVEKAITSGNTLILCNLDNEIDPFFFPIIGHINTKMRSQPEEESCVIKMNGRRLVIHPYFQLIFVFSSPNPDIPYELASTTTIVDLRPNANGILRFFLLRSLARLRPDLDVEDNKVYYELFQCYETLEKLDLTVMALIRGKEGSGMWDETESVTTLMKKRTQMAARFSNVLVNLRRLQRHREKFVPLSQCVLSAYKILLSLHLLRSEYQFSLDFLLSIFDKATEGRSSQATEKMVYAKEAVDKRGQEGFLRKGRERRVIKHTSELLGVNIDKMKHALMADGKDLYSQKAGASKSSSSEKPDVDAQIDLPDEVAFSVPEIDSNVDGEVKEVLTHFFKLFHHTVSKSLSSEHQKIFSLLCCMHMEICTFASIDSVTVDIITDQVHPQKWSSTVPKQPSWMPEKGWKSLVAISDTATYLKPIVHSIQSDPDLWHSWYASPTPEMLELPCDCEQEQRPLEQDDELPQSSQTEEPEEALHMSDASDFKLSSRSKSAKEPSGPIKRLLVVKFLRPDRFLAAFNVISLPALGDYQAKSEYSFEDLFLQPGTPSIILLPSSFSADYNTDFSGQSMSNFVVKMLKDKAEEQGVQLRQESVFEGNEKQINLSLSNAMSTESWIVIENLHLGDKSWLESFTRRLLRLYNQSGSGKSWRLFMTSEPFGGLPTKLLYLCEKISFDSLLLVKGREVSDYPLVVKNISQSMKLVDKDIWIEAKDRSLLYRDFLYAICVAHGYFLTMEVYSPRTFSTRARLTFDDLTAATTFVTKYFNSSSENINLSLHDVCRVICEEIYCSKALNECDKRYIELMFECIADGLSSDLGSTIQIGKWSVQLPPTNVDPVDYPVWCIEKMIVDDNEDYSLSAIHLPEKAGIEFKTDRSSEFTASLQKVYDKALKRPISFDAPSNQSCMQSKLRLAIDVCKDCLPPLLKIDEHFGMTVAQIKLNPHLRTLSLLSMRSATTICEDELPACVSYCLLKECQRLNRLVFTASSAIQELDNALLRGYHAISQALEDVALSLCYDRVPNEWLSCFRGSRLQSLHHWLSNVSNAYSQLSKWLKKGLVPNPNAEPTVGHGLFDTIDLNLLHNPQGLISSIKYTKALTFGISLDQVILRCRFAAQKNKFPPSSEGSDVIVLSNMYLDGAWYDTQKGCLATQRNSVQKLPYAYLTAEKEPCTDDIQCIKIPIFANMCRQQFLFEVELVINKDSNDAAELPFAAPYIFLDLLDEEVLT